MRRRFPKALNAVINFYSVAVYLEMLLLLTSQSSVYIKLLSGLFVIYLQAPFLWRILTSFYGPIPKVSFIGRKAETGNLWFAGHKLQEIYGTFDFLEKVLRTIPGMYSFWLRLWGARIGKKVNWTSGCKLVDRPQIHVGDRSLIGNLSYISAHAIKKRNGKYSLFTKDVHIHEDVVLSYLVTVAPGVTIEAGVFVESGSAIYPNQTVKKGQRYERFEELLNDRFNFLFQRN